MNKPLVIAHRGDTREHQENTIEAFKVAVQRGADMVEFDIHETADGQFLVVHDPSARPGDPVWSERPYAEHKRRLGADMPPLVRDAIQQLHGTPVNIEIKTCVHPQALLDALAQVDPAPGTVISSFDERMLRSFADARCTLPLFLIIGTSRKRSLMQNAVSVIRGLVPACVPKYLGGVVAHYSLVRPAYVRALHGRGQQVFVWTVNVAARIDKMRAIGVDGIATDNLGLFKTAI